MHLVARLMARVSVVAVDQPVQHTSSENVEITEIVPPVAAPVEPPRRRLAQTVTLGQSTNEPQYSPSPQPAQGQGYGTNVVVHNNVTVVNGQPTYYGGYGYGYGGYGYGRSGGVNGQSHDARGTGTPPQAWAPNGWEGAQRTAAPGHTPGVGGNFPTVPSPGPKQMK